MTKSAYYQASIQEFIEAESDAILGALAKHHRFSLEQQQKFAWQFQIESLKRCLPGDLQGSLFFEFSIPRMGKRADVVLMTGGVVFVVEFKVGSSDADRYAIEQVHDYALDLKNFHRGSHHLPIVPILIPTAIGSQGDPDLIWDADMVAKPVVSSIDRLAFIVQRVIENGFAFALDADAWADSGYQPTPTIVEAALALYRHHDVKEITRSEAGADNLGLTAERVEQIIEWAKSQKRKVICFITGVPGAGKTLAGLNIATSRADRFSDEHAVFLSGNGPLVDVLREALARDKSAREGVSRKYAYREVSAFVQNIHHFRDECLKTVTPPIEKVVIFDEAQRAWNRAAASKFMKQKRGYTDFDMSEPEFLIDAMDRNQDWCAVICLIGGGQEINTGEAGLTEWVTVLRDVYPNWAVFMSSRLDDRDYIWHADLADNLKTTKATWDESLHLGVSIRSFRAEALSQFVGYLLNDDPARAREVYQNVKENYPILLTRSLSVARAWVRAKARGSERYGLMASSGANRLRPEGIWMKAKIDAPVWFLSDKTDVRSSFYLEEVASEFDVQGLELDWSCVAWDADLRRTDNRWCYMNFRGSSWQSVHAADRQIFLKNAYRVLLTRARQGMAIYIPSGDSNDPTRLPSFYDEIYDYLTQCGLADS